MFENVATLLDKINVFGLGIYLLVAVIIFAIARGLSRDTEHILMYYILIGGASTLVLFNQDFIKGMMYVTVCIAVYVFGMVYIKPRWRRDK